MVPDEVNNFANISVIYDISIVTNDTEFKGYYFEQMELLSIKSYVIHLLTQQTFRKYLLFVTHYK